jgi:hypothetical protein
MNIERLALITKYHYIPLYLLPVGSEISSWIATFGVVHKTLSNVMPFDHFKDSKRYLGIPKNSKKD